MPLDDLVGVIETLKGRIAAHGASLRENETRTRMALIDPMLQALGWDVSDPAMVTPEYSVGASRADYDLLTPTGTPSALVEAKKLDESLASQLASHRMQMLNYANISGIPHAGLTDGNHWEMYTVFDQAPIEQRRILDVSIANTPTHEAALKLLLLWRPNLASGKPVAANAPVFIEHLDDPSVVPDPPAPTPVPDRSENWISLSIVEAGKGNLPPTAIKFAGREPRAIKSWSQVLEAVADRLSNDGLLKAADCPIPGLAFINSSAAHREVSGGLFVNVNRNANSLIKQSRKLLTHFNVDTATVELRFK